MKRWLGMAAAIVLAAFLLVPTVLAADPLPHTGRVLISVGGDITVPAGEHADAVIVVNGSATILGEVNAIVAVDGTVHLLGARTETIVAVRSPVEVGPGSVVQGDVMTLDSTVHQTGDAQVLGRVSDLATMLVGIGLVLGSALVLIWIGFGLALMFAGVLLAGLAARQVRQAEQTMNHEPIRTLAVGIVAIVLIPLVSIVLVATVIGAPLGLGILFLGWPLMACIGYLVAAVWIGDWVLGRMSPGQVRERPYLAAILGTLILGVLAVVPILSIGTMIASLLGFGAVIVLSLRTLRSRPVAARPTVAGPMPAPMAS